MHTWGINTSMEACSRCPAILLAPMWTVSPRVFVSLYSHLTIFPGVTVIPVLRTTTSNGSARWSSISTHITRRARAKCPRSCDYYRASNVANERWVRGVGYKRKRHKMFPPKEELNRVIWCVMLNWNVAFLAFSQKITLTSSHFEKKLKEEEEGKREREREREKKTSLYMQPIFIK